MDTALQVEFFLSKIYRPNTNTLQKHVLSNIQARTDTSAASLNMFQPYWNNVLKYVYIYIGLPRLVD